jgi:hypothetical protein
MIACSTENTIPPDTANDKRALVARCTVQHRQLDLFGVTPPRAAAPKPFDPSRLKQIALAVWRASRPVSGTLGERFFSTRRLAVPDAATVRFHPILKFNDVRAPGLVWKLVDQRSGEPCGVVRVYLAQDGTTVIGKRVLGRSVGASINCEPRPP